MVTRDTNLLFGVINFHGNTATYTAASDWQRLNRAWRIRMYPIHPNSGNPVEQSSIAMSAQELWPPTWKTVTNSERRAG
jgi:hypothetical protein